MPVPQPASPPLHKKQRSPDPQRGQALVELALVLPVLLLIVLAAIDFGRVFQGWVVLNNAARVAADYAAVHPTAWGSSPDATKQATYAALVQDAWSDAESSLTNCTSSAVPSPTFPAGKDLGDFAVVQIDCSFTPITPLIGDIFAAGGFQFDVSARSAFPIRTGSSGGTAAPPACPTPEFTWNYPDPTAWQTVDFIDTSMGDIVSWGWNFGDGSTSIDPNPLHTYLLDDTYTVTLTLDVGTSCEATYSADVLVEEGAEPPAEPQDCQVPNFVGTVRSTAQTAWAVAGFTTTVTEITPPNNDYTIEYQSLVGQSLEPCDAEVSVGPNPGGGGPGNGNGNGGGNG